MTARRPIVVSDAGELSELPIGDTIVGSGGSTSQYSTPQEIDEAATQYFYFGWVSKSGGWLVRRQNRENSKLEDANQASNSSHSNLATAWAVRTALGYI